MKQSIIFSVLLVSGLFSILASSSYIGSLGAVNTEHSAGIQFYNGTWEEILKRSKNENKIIFLDVSATWCGPCKKLKSTTFTDSNVSRLFNAKFINVNLDENDPKSAKVYKKYKIVQYPTLLFLDSSGSVLSSIYGYVSPKQLLSYASKLSSNDTK